MPAKFSAFPGGSVLARTGGGVTFAVTWYPNGSGASGPRVSNVEQVDTAGGPR